MIRLLSILKPFTNILAAIRLNRRFSIIAKKCSLDNNDKNKDKGGFVLPGIKYLGTEPNGNNAKTPIKPYSGEYVGEWFENR